MSCRKMEITDESQSMLDESDNRSDVNLELQQVLMDLESAVCGRRRNPSLSGVEVDQYIEELLTASPQWELALQIQAEKEDEVKLGNDFYPTVCEERVRWENELEALQEENKRLIEKLRNKDKEQSQSKATKNTIQEERDHLHQCLWELQTRIQGLQSDGDQVTLGAVSSTEQDTGETDRNISSTAKSLQDVYNSQSIFHTHRFNISDNKIQEFQLEAERLNSRIEHLKSQNDLLTVTLVECKSETERMSKLVDKYESNATGLRLSLHYSEQCINAYELLLALTETQQDLVLGLTPQEPSCEKDVPVMLKDSCDLQPRKGVSTSSPTRYSTTSSSSNPDAANEEEQRLKDYIKQLQNQRAAVKHTHTLSWNIKPHDSHRLDLENAVLMQELMAMKEEIAEMKAHLYLLEKEKKVVELKLSTQETSEQAFLVQMEHLKSEVEEQQEQRRRSQDFSKDNCAKESSVMKVSELTGISDPAAELTNILKKEMKLKVRVKELLAALEKLSKCSEIRNQQSAEFIGDLSQANSNLVAIYEKAKKKHQNKLKKLEAQMVSIMERQETEACVLKQRINRLEEEISQLYTNETSL